MSNKRTILIETVLVVGVLTTGLAAANAAHAMPLHANVQAAGSIDQRANVKIESVIKVERIEKNADGIDVAKLFTPNEVKVVPGDNLVFVNVYTNTGSTPVTGFVVNNPVHSAVSFTSVSEDWALVSVDGGKTYGKLTDLVVMEAAEPSGAADGADTPKVSRTAQPADVTHIRWVFAQPIGGGKSGNLTFRGVVK